MSEPNIEQRMVRRWATAVNRLLQVGTIASLVVIGARAFSGSSTVKVWEIDKVPLNAIWLGLVIATVIHAFTAYFLVTSIFDLRGQPGEQGQKTYEDLMAEGGSFVSITVRRLPVPDSRRVPMSLRDASTWVSHGSAVAATLACLPWWWHGGLRWAGWATSILIASVTLMLVIVNWLIGSSWAIAVSQLGLPLASRPQVTDPGNRNGRWLNLLNPTILSVPVMIIIAAVASLGSCR